MPPFTARDISVPLQDGWSLEAQVSDDGGIHDIALYHPDYDCVTVPWGCLGFMTRDKTQSFESLVVAYCNAHAAEWDDDDRAAEADRRLKLEREAG